ncbi:hypothetical protein [Streptomyces sp. MMBL 11-1]|uniref:hypothetical protein n=1 Tax=Streptomyces sp. MMBL 11-1 TaxID=3026420 RepID=UPI0023631822|nr:hypothetical protein [Streptomyces sp. MMBL 11-1]
MDPFENYAIQHPDGRWLYHLPAPPGSRSTPVTGMLADGRPMAPLGERTGTWWVTDHHAERITARMQPRPVPVRYELIDRSALSARYPEMLSAEEWTERNEEVEDDNYYRFYRAVTEEQPALTYEYEGPFRVLEGSEPPAPGAPPWVARMPHSLTERREYLHCFPGHIPGLRSHLKDLITRMLHVQYCFDGRDDKPAGLYVTIRVPFQEPVSRWQPNLGKNLRELKSGREVPVLVSREMYLPVADRVPAGRYTDALSAWEQQVSFWTGLVQEAGVKACNHCGGTGHVLDSPHLPC